ncbi:MULTISPECIES: GNAT family N-acetyltransferase [unclassified Duganella]|uniref:GNAT family N-acetyltransferase n=1 Tax=unclassified Duganella TaxID=2636909 RepID=UPI0006F9FA81|nr:MULTISPECIES: GNAT family N-acetyltransferase [unclassified Duganella]KQV59095.1 acetyltransferase [Duganella sp. Root336D2]KRB93381.1 acetyltransferase [Duganella sp. Root198D2]
MIEWQWQDFNSIPNADLYEMLRQRQEVFVIEQQCFYSDMDGYDAAAHHLLGWQTVDGKRTLAAYLRCIAPGIKYPEMALGRVLTAQAARGSGAGRALIAEGIRNAEALHPGHRIRIGAQAHLEKFYGSFGFKAVGEPYDEDGIAHLEMLR